MQMKKKAAFTLGDLPSIGIALVIFAVVLGIGATILSNIQETQTTNSFAYNASQGGLEGLDTLSNYQTTIAIVAIAAVVIGIILVFFGRGMG